MKNKVESSCILLRGFVAAMNVIVFRCRTGRNNSRSPRHDLPAAPRLGNGSGESSGTGMHCGAQYMSRRRRFQRRQQPQPALASMEIKSEVAAQERHRCRREAPRRRVHRLSHEARYDQSSSRRNAPLVFPPPLIEMLNRRREAQGDTCLVRQTLHSLLDVEIEHAALAGESDFRQPLLLFRTFNVAGLVVRVDFLMSETLAGVF